jgi:Zn-dependent protease with chaperone function
MTGAGLLACYAVVVGFPGPALLRRGWAVRAPRLAICLWLALALSWVVAAPLSVLAVVAPAWLSWTGPGTRGPAPGTTALAAPALVLAAAVVLWTAACVARELASARRARREHATALEAAGHPDRPLGAVIVNLDAPMAYCMPGRCRRIVVSTGALAMLGPEQLRAVLAHERAHLRARHHAALALASGLARAFPRVPLLAQARAQLAVLAEMAADDAAARRHDPGDLAAALVVLGRARARAGALTAGGPAAIARVQRLLAPPPRPGRPARAAGFAAGAAALMLAAAVACLSLIAVGCGIAGWA